MGQQQYKDPNKELFEGLMAKSLAKIKRLEEEIAAEKKKVGEYALEADQW